MFKLSNDIVIKKRNNTYFGLNMLDGATYEMNESQFRILEFFKSDYKTIDELISYLLEIYDINKENLKPQVEFSINQLLDNKILIEKSLNNDNETQEIF